MVFIFFHTLHLLKIHKHLVYVYIYTYINARSYIYSQNNYENVKQNIILQKLRFSNVNIPISNK